MKTVIETVVSNGMQLEVGKVYEFGDSGLIWFAGNLCGIYNGKFKTDLDSFNYIRKCEAGLGTITPAPVDLVDGAAYAFEYQDEDMLGRYHKWSNRFVIGNSNIKANKVKGITRLVPEVKS